MTESSGAGPPTTEPPRRRGPRSDAVANRGRLQAASAEVFAQQGPSARLEDIAHHAGVGVGTAYRHLGTREAALYEVMAARIAELAELAATAEQIDDPWEALRWYVSELAAHTAGDRSVLALMANQGPVSPEQAVSLRGLIEPRTAVLVERAKAAGRLRADFAVSDLPMILAGIDRVAARTRTTAPGTWQRLLCLLLDGLETRREGTTPMTAPALEPRQIRTLAASTTGNRRR